MPDFPQQFRCFLEEEAVETADLGAGNML